MPTLAIIIVSWNVRELLRRCLVATEASLAGGNIGYEIIVVDNASADGTPAMLRAEFPHVRLIETGANLGFAAGNNVGLRLVMEKAEGSRLLPSSDYILLLNPDTEPVGDALPRLVAELERRPELAAVGPLLRYGDGSLQPSRRRFPTRLTFFWESTPLDRLWPTNPWAARYRCADTPADQAQPVDWLVGAAILLRSKAIARAGLFDERFFMYSEELEWQRRIQTAWTDEGGRSAIWYLPTAEIIHHEGKSSEQAIARRHLNFQQSRLLLARIWYGWPFAALLRAFTRLGYLGELAIEAAKLLLGHRRDLRLQRISVYWQVICGL